MARDAGLDIEVEARGDARIARARRHEVARIAHRLEAQQRVQGGRATGPRRGRDVAELAMREGEFGLRHDSLPAEFVQHRMAAADGAREPVGPERVHQRRRLRDRR
jgi:hypothetical protein